MFVRVSDRSPRRHSKLAPSQPRKRITRFLGFHTTLASISVLDSGRNTVRTLGIGEKEIEMRVADRQVRVSYDEALDSGATFGSGRIRLLSVDRALVEADGESVLLDSRNGWLTVRQGRSVLACCGTRNLQLHAVVGGSRPSDPVPYAVSTPSRTPVKQDILFSRAVPLHGAFGAGRHLARKGHDPLGSRHLGVTALLAAALSIALPDRAEESAEWCCTGTGRSDAEQENRALAIGDATALAAVLSGVEAAQAYWRLQADRQN
jgi:hypothetical protein